MSLTQTIRTINGQGKPRLIVEKAETAWQSIGAATYTSTSATEALGAAGNITSSNATTDEILQTAHGFTAKMRIRIAGHTGSTPDLNGDHTVIEVIDDDHYLIGKIISVGGTGGTARQIPDYTNVRAGMRVVSGYARSGGSADKIVYGRITAIDRTGFVITIAAGWVGGTPDNGKTFKVNGWVIDLPYCFDLTETFTPDQLLHNLWRSRIEQAEWYGWGYAAALDYAKHIRADVLLSMRPALNLKKGDMLILVPHIDKPQYNYAVIYGDPVSLSRYGLSPGHRKVAFGFRGTEPIATWPMPESGWGFGYGTRYGINSD